ncbi:ATPase, T2SS/T4P/T4SS family [Candidatus Riflebacteria bacterium]
MDEISHIVNDSTISLFLSDNEFFKFVEESDRLRLAKKMIAMQFQTGEEIIKEGSRTGSLFLIARGSCEVKKSDISTGICFRVTTLSKGSIFGEMSLITNHPHNASIVALEKCLVYKVDQKSFLEIIEASPSLCWNITQILASRIERINQTHGMPYIDLERFRFDPSVLSLIPKKVIEEFKLIPISLKKNVLTMAMVNPENLFAFDALQKYIHGLILEPVIMTESDFKLFMDTKYQELSQSGITTQVTKSNIAFRDESKMLEVDFIYIPDDEPSAEENLRIAAETKGILNLSTNILALALKKEAEALHIEPEYSCFRVKFREHGQLKLIQSLPKKLYGPLITRFKLLSGLNPNVTNIPQRGSMTIKHNDRNIFFLVSFLPGIFGEKLSIFLSDSEVHLKPVETFFDFLAPNSKEKLTKALLDHRGNYLLVGPHNSSKTYLYYSILKYLQNNQMQVQSLEKFISIRIEGLHQTLMRGEDKRTLLDVVGMQNPDWLACDYLWYKKDRDFFLSWGALKKQLLLVFEADNLYDLFNRLNRLGIDPAYFSGVFFCSQLPLLCEHCKEEISPEGGISLGIEKAFEKVGCNKCFSSGFSGSLFCNYFFEKVQALSFKYPEELRQTMSDVYYDKLRDAMKEGIISFKSWLNFCKHVLGKDFSEH